MLHGGLAYMEVSGVRPDVKGKHKTVIDYLAHALGKDRESQIQFFDHMRRRRHQLIYEPGPFGCSEKEMWEAEQTVVTFLNLISERIKSENPQKELEL